MSKLLLIDGNSIVFRAFYALPPLSNKQGMYTNAVFGFTTMLLRMLDEQKPTHVLVAFDAGKQTFRHQQYAEYKAGRSKTPLELSQQFPLVRELLEALGIPTLENLQYEADDIIGSYAAEAERMGIEAVVVSGDKDLLQVVSPTVRMALTRKGISEVELYDVQHLHEVYGLRPEQIPDLKGLMGDTSDNIPGVPGVGEKTALKLLHEFGTVEQVLASTDQLKGKMKEKIEQHAEDARLSKRLATIERAMPLEVALEALAFNGLRAETGAAMFRRLEFKSLAEKLGALAAGGPGVGGTRTGGSGAVGLDAGGQVPGSTGSESETLMNLVIVDSAERWLELDAALPAVRAIHVETSGDNPHQAELLGFSFVVSGAGESAVATEYIVFFLSAEEWIVNAHLERSAALRNWFANALAGKAVHDLNRTAVVLGWSGVQLAGVQFDTSLAAYLLNPTETRNAIDELTATFTIRGPQSDEQVYGKGAKFKLPAIEVLAEHVARKALAVQALEAKMLTALSESTMIELFEKLELPLASLLAQLELTGVRVETETLREYGVQLSEQIEGLVVRIYEQAGEQFNINSTRQLGEILFEKLNLPSGKKTKTGYSTDAEELERLAPYAQIVRDLLHYRQLTKLNSTYVEGLLKESDVRTGKVHTYFHQTTTATGRLSSQYPNLQNIPIRLEEGRLIRKAFVPSEPGWSILSADYSQIELRVLAHISGDERLIDAFQRDMDIHTKTAMDVFGVTQSEVDGDMRRQAKAVNFGIVYGISDYGLSQNLGITRKQAAAFIEQYFAVFAGVKKYMEDIVRQAREDGFVRTLLNRRRYLPDIRSSNYNIRSFAERTAMNTPIQGTAADIIKLAMVEMAKRMAVSGLRSRMLLQVHDELVFEVPPDELPVMQSLTREVMEHALPLSVPLKVDMSHGGNWYEAK